MKTAISVPDETFDLAEQRADQLGISRSEFFTKAVQHYLADLDKGSLTREIDAALDLISDDDSSDFATQAGRVRLTEGDEW